jgi:hypothetical protein
MTEEANRMFNVSPTDVAELIRDKILELDQERPRLFDTSQSKAQAISDYDRAIALVVLKLKNETIREFEGELIGKLPVTLIPIIAKGICYKECFMKEAEEGGYKAVISNIEAIKAGLNGLQSVNKHLDNLK